MYISRTNENFPRYIFGRRFVFKASLSPFIRKRRWARSWHTAAWLSLYENSVAQICFHHVDNWKETVMFRSRYKRSQLWGSPVVFFSLFSVVVPDMHKKGRFWAFHFVIDYAVVLPLQLQQVTFQTDPHSSSVCVLTFFYLCRNYSHIWYGDTAYRTQEENVWGCDKMICPVLSFWR